MPSHIGNRLCWIGYALLAASSGGSFWGYAYLAAPVACVLACWQRRRASNSGDIVVYDHSLWIINTFIVILLLYLLGLIAMVSLFYAIGNDEMLMASLSALEQKMSTGRLSEPERISLLFSMPSMQLLFGGALLWWFLLAWPLKRIAHGMLSLWKNIDPQLLSCRHQLSAAGVALVLQFLLFLCFFF